MDSTYSPRRRHPILRICTVIFLLLLLAGGIWAYHAGLFTGSSGPLEYGDLDSLPWNLILVNQDHAIPDNWSQELTTLSNGTQVDSRIYPELQQMFDDMRAQGVYPVVASGYRSAEKQQSLMDDKIQGVHRPGRIHCAGKAGRKEMGQSRGLQRASDGPCHGHQRRRRELHRRRSIHLAQRARMEIRLHPPLSRRQNGHHRHRL